MATRREAKRRALLQVLTVIVIAAVIIAAVVLVQTWLRNRPDPLPQDTSVTVSVGDNKQEIFPYLISEPGTEGKEGDVPRITVAPEDTVTITVPDHVWDHEWSAVMIYTDPAANDQVNHSPHETNTVTIPASLDPAEGSDTKPELAVVEIQSVLIGQDANGNESPYTVVWSVATQHAENS